MADNQDCSELRKELMQQLQQIKKDSRQPMPGSSAQSDFDLDMPSSQTSHVPNLVGDPVSTQPPVQPPPPTPQVLLPAATPDLTATLSTILTTMTKLASDVQVTKANQMQLLNKPDTDVQFNRKGNRIQHTFNEKIFSDFSQVELNIDAGDKASAKDVVASGKKKIRRRNKLVRIADSTELGWDLVEAYEQSELASDEEDDKKLRRAMSSARAEKKRKLAAAKPKYKHNYSRSQVAVPPPVQAQAVGFHQQQPFPVAPGSYYGSGGYYNGGGFQDQRSRNCFGCGGTGHIKRYCPYRQQSPAGAVPNKKQ